jgi:hypothetical protein
MKFIRSKKGIALAASLVVVIAGAVGAYAYFTAAGSGTGTFTSGNVGAITISSATVGPLFPQTDSSQTTALTVTVHNGGASSQYVGQITGTVATNGGCQGSWFSVASIAAPGVLTPGDHTFSSSVILNDNGGNQDACAGQTETINWASAAG